MGAPDHNGCPRQRLTGPAHSRRTGRVPGAGRYHAAVLTTTVLRHAALAMAALVGPAAAAPFTPASDAQVLATVPARALDPDARALLALRQAWQRAPRALDPALAYARRCLAQVAADGDPRSVGHAQAALAPWFGLADPPPSVRLLRAQILQFDHQFDVALADLDALLRLQPGNLDAWAWRAAIHLVRADYTEARRSCTGLAPLAPPLVAAACAAQVDAATGRAAAAADALRLALAASPDADADTRLWVLTRLAETEERRGAWGPAEVAFRTALGLGLPDVYLQAAYADFLLDRGRPAEVLALLKDRGGADVLLLRLALAAKATGDAAAPAHARALAARFDAARRRGDTSHQKEESRFLLGVVGDAAGALRLAQANFALQKEPADARILLEAALLARQPAAARPVLDWMARSGIESVVLHELAGDLALIEGRRGPPVGPRPGRS